VPTGCPDIAWSVTGGTTSTAIVRDAYSIPRPVGTTGISITLESWSLDGLAISGGVFIRFLDADGNSLNGPSGTTIGRNGLTVPSVVVARDYPTGTTTLAFGYEIQAPGTVPPTGVSLAGAGTLSFTGDCTAGPLCEYGTELQPTFLKSIIISTTVIDLLCTALAAPEIAIIFTGLIGYTWQTGILCDGLPPGIPPSFAGAVTDGIYPVAPSFGDVLQFFQALAWPTFCQCKAAPLGLPPVTIPVIPHIVPPTNIGPGGGHVPVPPASPPATCDNTDLCTILNNHTYILQTINGETSAILKILQNLAIPGVDNSYQIGPTWTGLTGNGAVTSEFGAPVILGVVVSATTLPAGMGRDEAYMPVYENLGYISFSTHNGYQFPIKLVHPIQVEFTNVLQCTQVEYSLEPGVMADIQLYLRKT